MMRRAWYLSIWLLIIGATCVAAQTAESEPIGTSDEAGAYARSDSLTNFEGLNAQILLRTAQLRGIYPLGSRSISVSIEDPAPDLTGANGVSLVPDLVVGTEWEVGR